MIWPLPSRSSFRNDRIFWKMLIIELFYLIKFAKILLNVAFVWKRFDHNIILGIVKIVIIYCIWSAPKSGQKRPQERIKKKVGDVLIAKILKNPFPTGKYQTKKPHIYFEFSRYYCFCGREENPESEYGATPHSCGQPCSRSRSGCNHSCNLLCHPGPCPPCEASEKVKCSCGKTEAFVKCGVQAGNKKLCSVYVGAIGKELESDAAPEPTESLSKLYQLAPISVNVIAITILFYSQKAQMRKYLW